MISKGRGDFFRFLAKGVCDKVLSRAAISPFINGGKALPARKTTVALILFVTKADSCGN